MGIRQILCILRFALVAIVFLMENLPKLLLNIAKGTKIIIELLRLNIIQFL
jgi:hypothetical protein